MIKLRKILLKEYTKRLLTVLSEVEVVDDNGNVIISKDLKVRHKDSGFEYTVDDVITNDEKIQVILRDPEEPRVEPEGDEGMIMDNLNEPPSEPTEFNAEEPENQTRDSEVFYVIDKEEFEKEYEVD